MLEVRTRSGGNCILDRLPAGGQFGSASLKRLSLLCHGGLEIVLLIGPIHCGEHGLEAVVILLGDGIELVVVALGALDRQAVEGLEGVDRHVIAVEVAGDFAVELGLGHFGVTDEIPRSGGDESQCFEPVAGSGEQDIPGHLFLNEPGVGLVLIEAANHVIPVRPGVGSGLILVVTVGLTVVNHVEPVSGPAFAVMRRGEQAIHKMLVGQGIGIGHKGFNLRGARRETQKVEVQTPNQRSSVGGGRRTEALGGQRLLNERVDRMDRNGAGSREGRDGWPGERLQRPPIGGHGILDRPDRDHHPGQNRP